MAVTSFKLPTAVIQNGTGVNGWLNPNNILLVDGDFTSTSDTTAELVVGTFNLNIPVDATISNFTVRVKGYRGSFNTTLQIYAVDTTTGVTQSFPMAPFQGFDGTNTLYTLSSTLFSTTWTSDMANNIQLKLMVDGELHVDSVEINCTYVPAVVPVPPPPPTGQVVVDEFVQAIRFQVAQSMTASDLFMYATSFNLPNGVPIQYSDFHGEALIVIDQGVAGLEENARITNVEHDYNGTGLVRLSFGTLANRGLNFVYPYTSDASRIYPHNGTAEFVISNSAPFYNRFLRRNQIGALVSAPITVEDEGNPLTSAATTLDFEGAGVTVTVDGLDPQKMIITIPGGGTGGGHVIQDNGTPLPQEPALNFKDYFTVTDNPGVATDVDINVVELAGDTTFINTLTSNITFQNAVNSFVGGSGAIQIDQTPDNGTYGLLAGAVNGSNTLYTVSLGVYSSGKLQVYLNGLIQLQGASDDWQQTTPASGTFSFNVAPLAGDIITVVYNTVSSGADNYTVKATSADTTPSYLDNKISVISSDSSVDVTKTINNPGANEDIEYDLSVSTGNGTVLSATQFLPISSVAAGSVAGTPLGNVLVDTGTKRIFVDIDPNTTNQRSLRIFRDQFGSYYQETEITVTLANLSSTNGTNLDQIAWTIDGTHLYALVRYRRTSATSYTKIDVLRYNLDGTGLVATNIYSGPSSGGDQIEWDSGARAAVINGSSLFTTWHITGTNQFREYTISGTSYTLANTYTVSGTPLGDEWGLSYDTITSRFYLYGGTLLNQGIQKYQIIGSVLTVDGSTFDYGELHYMNTQRDGEGFQYARIDNFGTGYYSIYTINEMENTTTGTDRSSFWLTAVTFPKI